MTLRPSDVVELRIDRMSYGGRGVARLDGFVVFVDDAAPGDRLSARLRVVKKSYAEAEPVRISEASPLRIAPSCPHFGPCGGCLWQHLAYRAQLEAKRAIVAESLAQLGGIEHVAVRPVIGMDDPWRYRNKMEFTFLPGGGLGLHRRGRWDEVVDLSTCLLPSPRVVDVLVDVKAFARRHNLPGYDPRRHQGLLRQLVVREGRATGDLLVTIVTATGQFPQARALADHLAGRHAGLTGVLWAVNPARGDTIELQGAQVLYGRPYIFERLRGLTFKIGPATFFQTNTLQAERMIDVVREMAGEAEEVVDLYCGVGTFALALAGQSRRVHGVEVVAASVEAAQENARLNGIANADFYVADVRRFVRLPAGGRPDLVILDPPRAGAGRQVMTALGRAAPRRVIYISCNPTTLAPDLRHLLPAGYRILAIQPFDLFPHTYHVECVVLLERETP
ncbi:MAG: 23S rRNA (uracil(1939)-C(5))-methyltransferase RlmD [Armatimonadota bacterium]|nr:23S rRNA (uracil(1939)-C(5))-methyltransferase RlmD [Armatimonadota bacterium]MDR7452546.1 23S rRNA (uracil(1939)-C(5))-methyltransferase RlmD [Armatimonadota bacterium]MDR7466876.1 23S rRNA (uracil(1939)-C(5))-methyltransferase RlmD [Armatimonadota bacterium]MDR7492651.1 23S rRNA (uracil(1939)-C(5))-methyltransferase RlmD [Armatimonadota bacterium]MDR7499987.1 23S rRNA (uracil(1939)-C(5))-methyltransferase RlmD [Armatimonadota bacterium]